MYLVYIRMHWPDNVNVKEYRIYGLYNKSAPFFGDLKNFPETKNKSQFCILKLFFLSHDNYFSCPVTRLLNISLGRIGSYFCLVSIERGHGQDKYFHRWRSYYWFIHSQSIKLVHDLALYQLSWILGVQQYIDISQYTKNIYRIAIRNLYRNISWFFFLLIKLFVFHSSLVL